MKKFTDNGKNRPRVSKEGIRLIWNRDEGIPIIELKENGTKR